MMPTRGVGGGVDVSDMLCAQALALVAQALSRVTPGEALAVRYTTQDVKQDLLIWADRLGHRVSEPEPSILRIEGGPPPW